MCKKDDSLVTEFMLYMQWLQIVFGSDVYRIPKGRNGNA
jgi:hypothetical protein